MFNNEPYSISGEVHEVGELQTFSKGFTKRTLILVDDPGQEYPDYAAIEYHKDKTQLLASLKPGERVTATFWPEARPWKDPKTGKAKWFSSLRGIGLKIEGVNAADLTAMPDEPPQPPTSAADAELDQDDLPF